MQEVQEQPPEAKGHVTPIYVSYLTFNTFLDWIADMAVVPTQIDRSLWSSKFSGVVGAQLMPGLRFLGLIQGNNNRPTETLHQLVAAERTQRKELLREVFRNAYGSDTVDHISGMTPRMLDEQLKKLGTTDSTHRKAVSFFVNAAKAVELPVPAAIAKKARNRPQSPKRRQGTGDPGRTSQNGADSGPVRTGTEHGQIRDSDDFENVDSRTVNLRGGGQLRVRINRGALSLRGPDRALVFKINDLLDEFESEAEQPRLVMNGQ